MQRRKISLMVSRNSMRGCQADCLLDLLASLLVLQTMPRFTKPLRVGGPYQFKLIIFLVPASYSSVFLSIYPRMCVSEQTRGCLPKIMCCVFSQPLCTQEVNLSPFEAKLGRFYWEKGRNIPDHRTAFPDPGALQRQATMVCAKGRVYTEQIRWRNCPKSIPPRPVILILCFLLSKSK